MCLSSGCSLDVDRLRRLCFAKSVFMNSYKNLDVWKTSMQLVKEVYLLTKISEGGDVCFNFSG